MNAIVGGERKSNGLPCFGGDGLLVGWSHIPNPEHHTWVFDGNGRFMCWKYEPPQTNVIVRTVRRIRRWWWYRNALPWERQYARSVEMRPFRTDP